MYLRFREQRRSQHMRANPKGFGTWSGKSDPLSSHPPMAVEQTDTGLAVLLNWIHETPISLSQGTSLQQGPGMEMQSAWHSSVMLLRSQVDFSQRTDTYVTNRPLQQAIRAAKAGGTWRFMGSYKYGSKSPKMGVITIVTLLITPQKTTHEPPSRTLRTLHPKPLKP